MKQINLEEISILQMQIFITAANELNYTRTANICNVTQPTVSRSIDALEKTLGLTLFYKRSNRMQVTPAGKVIHDCFQEVLCELYRNIQIGHELQDGIGAKLRVTFPLRTNISRILAPSIQNFKEESGAHIEYKDSEHMVGIQYLLENRVDVMFTSDFDINVNGRNDELNHSVVLSAPMKAFMLRTNPLSCKRKLSFDDLRDQKLMVPKWEKDSYYNKRMEQWFRELDYAPVISRYCDFALEGAVNIQNDDEILLTDSFSLPFHLPHLVEVQIENTETNITMLWRKKEIQDGIVMKFVDYITEYARSGRYSIFE